MTNIKKLFLTPKRIVLSCFCIIVFLAMLVGGSIFVTAEIVETNSIGLGVAIDTVIADSGFAENQITVTRAALTLNDGIFVYSVKFKAEDAMYEYVVKADDGSILDTKIILKKLSPGEQPDTSAWIGIENAKVIALTDAGVDAEAAVFTKEKYDSEDGIYVYELKFTVGEAKYEYEINVLTGDIVDKEIPVDTSLFIGIDAAKAAALADANIAIEDAVFNREELDEDDGIYAYCLKFTAGETKYSYTIDALTGAVSEKYSKLIAAEPDPEAPPVVIDETLFIGLDAAKAAALADAGVAAEAVEFTKEKLDRDDDECEYELVFVTAELIYKYDIDALTGIITESSVGSIKKCNCEEGKCEHRKDDDDDDDDDDRHEGKHKGEDEKPELLPENYIGVDAAKEIALKHAGLGGEGFEFRKAKLDKEDGKMIYEIKIKFADRCREFEIDAFSGDILEDEYDD